MANWVPKWFERKASQFGPLMARFVLGRAVWPNRSAALQASEGYQKNIIAYRCIRMVAEAAASVPFILYDGKKEIDSHPLLDLLDQPNPLQDGASLLEAWYSFGQISGNFYLERVDGLRNEPGELYTLRPDRVRVVPGENGFPAGWEYTVAGQTRRVMADFDAGKIPILHMKLFHPSSDWYGMSPLDPAAWSVDAFSAAAAYSKAILDNSAVPSGAIKVLPNKDGTSRNLDEKQRERLRGEIESRYSGAANAGRPMVLDGGLDWVQFGLTMDDLQFVDTKRDSARDIALAFGVPPMMLGIPGDNTYSNYQEANKAFWRMTVLPLASRTAKALTNWLCPCYGKVGSQGRGLHLAPNADGIDALAEDRKQQWDRINGTAFLTLNEKREAIGYKPVKDGDVYVLAKGTTIASLEDMKNQPKNSSGKPDEADNAEDPDNDAD